MNQKTSSGFPVLSILGLIFITLKLTSYIAWSWWWVLAPFWIPAVVVLSILLLLFIVAFVNGTRR